jgi:hypothetical protein
MYGTTLIITGRLFRSNIASNKPIGNAFKRRQFASSAGGSSTGMMKNMAMFGAGKSALIHIFNLIFILIYPHSIIHSSKKLVSLPLVSLR